jgi:hypothetical protein
LSSHKKTLFVTNLLKINMFWFSSITRLKHDLTWRVWYVIFFILDEIPHSLLEGQFFPRITKQNPFFVINLFKINIFWFSSITRLKQDLTRRVWYVIFFNLDEIPHLSLEDFNIWLSSFYWGINYLFVNCGQWGPCLQ